MCWRCDTARLFGLVNIALADACIAGWDAKFQHDFWRPISAIRAAADDGNDATEPDASWVPLLDTPPVQDHPSTHSIADAAAAVVLASAVVDRGRPQRGAVLPPLQRTGEHVYNSHCQALDLLTCGCGVETGSSSLGSRARP